MRDEAIDNITVVKEPENTSQKQWDIERVQAMIDERREEALTLDYKASAALINKKELAKDISAFANSDGGTIVYGVLEGEGENKHKPIAIDDGITPVQKTKESIENTILDSIRPKISGVMIYPVDLPTGNQLFVVEVPQSKSAPHMANHRYYKRYNFQSVPMEDYEVRDVMNRHSGPDLDLDFNYASPDRIQEGLFGLRPVLSNSSPVPAEHAIVKIWIDDKLVRGIDPVSFLGSYFKNIQPFEPLQIEIEEVNGETVLVYRGIIPFKADVPVFGSVAANLCVHNRGNIQFRIHVPSERPFEEKYYIGWELEAPYMQAKKTIHEFTVRIEEAGFRVSKKRIER